MKKNREITLLDLEEMARQLKMKARLGSDIKVELTAFQKDIEKICHLLHTDIPEKFNRVSVIVCDVKFTLIKK